MTPAPSDDDTTPDEPHHGIPVDLGGAVHASSLDAVGGRGQPDSAPVLEDLDDEEERRRRQPGPDVGLMPPD